MGNGQWSQRTDEGARVTTITWQELAEYQRDRAILDWIDADFRRQCAVGGAPGLRQIVGDLLDAGEDLSKTLAEACRSFAKRRRGAHPANPPVEQSGPA